MVIKQVQLIFFFLPLSLREVVCVSTSVVVCVLGFCLLFLFQKALNQLIHSDTCPTCKYPPPQPYTHSLSAGTTSLLVYCFIFNI